jgi:hypothetical protein
MFAWPVVKGAELQENELLCFICVWHKKRDELMGVCWRLFLIWGWGDEVDTFGVATTSRSTILSLKKATY